jgi:hypothetical protein
MHQFVAWEFVVGACSGSQKCIVVLDTRFLERKVIWECRFTYCYPHLFVCACFPSHIWRGIFNDQTTNWLLFSASLVAARRGRVSGGSALIEDQIPTNYHHATAILHRGSSCIVV